MKSYDDRPRQVSRVRPGSKGYATPHQHSHVGRHELWLMIEDVEITRGDDMLKDGTVENAGAVRTLCEKYALGHGITCPPPES